MIYNYNSQQIDFSKYFDNLTKDELDNFIKLERSRINFQRFTSCVFDIIFLYWKDVLRRYNIENKFLDAYIKQQIDLYYEVNKGRFFWLKKIFWKYIFLIFRDKVDWINKIYIKRWYNLLCSMSISDDGLNFFLFFQHPDNKIYIKKNIENFFNSTKEKEELINDVGRILFIFILQKYIPDVVKKLNINSNNIIRCSDELLQMIPKDIFYVDIVDYIKEKVIEKQVQEKIIKPLEDEIQQKIIFLIDEYIERKNIKSKYNDMYIFTFKNLFLSSLRYTFLFSNGYYFQKNRKVKDNLDNEGRDKDVVDKVNKNEVDDLCHYILFSELIPEVILISVQNLSLRSIIHKCYDTTFDNKKQRFSDIWDISDELLRSKMNNYLDFIFLNSENNTQKSKLL